MKHCEICGGRGTLRAPRRQPPNPEKNPVSMGPGPDSYKEFPCPECGPVVSESHVMILNGASFRPADEKDPEWVRYERECIADRLAGMMLKAGLIKFSEQPSKQYSPFDQIETRGRVGVVSPVAVASMEERIAKRQMAIAEEVINKAAAAIRHFGSRYSGRNGNISKDVAVSCLAEAMAEVTKNNPHG